MPRWAPTSCGCIGFSTCGSSDTRAGGSPPSSPCSLYVNFFSHHYIWDARWLLLLAILTVYGPCMMHFRIFRARLRMPIVVAFVLVALFIWIAENVATWSQAWSYPNQADGWELVSIAKLGSWLLLMIISVVLVAWVYPPLPLDVAPEGADDGQRPGH